MSDHAIDIGMYYAALFPFFFASGIFIGLSFLTGRREIPRLYMVDLVGAGTGETVLLCSGSSARSAAGVA